MSKNEKCPDCGHPVIMHYDDRGCHTLNCPCKEFYEIAAKRKPPSRYVPEVLPEKAIPRGKTYLDVLWREIQEWHGDCLKNG